MKIFPLVAIFLLSVSATAGVYKWTDATGVHYSDKPPKTDAEQLDIKTVRTDPARLAASSEPQAPAPETLVTEEAAQEAVEREQKIRRDENCARAKQALKSLFSATRVYEPLPDGERRYLEQEEIDQRKTTAQADVDQWCNNSD